MNENSDVRKDSVLSVRLRGMSSISVGKSDNEMRTEIGVDGAGKRSIDMEKPRGLSAFYL